MRCPERVNAGFEILVLYYRKPLSLNARRGIVALTLRKLGDVVCADLPQALFSRLKRASSEFAGCLSKVGPSGAEIEASDARLDVGPRHCADASMSSWRSMCAAMRAEWPCLAPHAPLSGSSHRCWDASLQNRARVSLPPATMASVHTSTGFDFSNHVRFVGILAI